MIIPVIIENDIEEISKRVEICRKFSQWVQIDITEPECVGTSTITDLDEITRITGKLNIDLDLMVTNPTGYLVKKYPSIKKISFYVTDDAHVAEFIKSAKAYGYKVGLNVGPETHIEVIHKNIGKIDFVQFYTVTPGAKGQKFQPDVLTKISEFRKLNPKIKIQVDGAVSKHTLPDLKTAGVNDFIVGSAIFSASNPEQMYIELTNMVNTKEDVEINSLLDFPGKEKIIQVAILGGAAWQPDDQPYIDAFETSKLLAEHGYEVVNGGGPGVMQASTKGAHAGGGRVLAITYYPSKPKRHYEGRDPENDFDTEVKTLDYFDRTKVMLQTTQAHIVFKGSIGTLSEFGMTWISSWIHEPHNKPIILYGEFWHEFIDLIDKHMLIVKGEEKMMKICTSPKQVIDYLASLD